MARTTSAYPWSLWSSARTCCGTQYGVRQADIIEALIGLVQKANVRVIDTSQRSSSWSWSSTREGYLGDRIPDGQIVAASLQAGARRSPPSTGSSAGTRWPPALDDESWEALRAASWEAADPDRPG